MLDLCHYLYVLYIVHLVNFNERIHYHLVFCSCLTLLLMFISVVVEIASNTSSSCQAVNTVHNCSRSCVCILNVPFSLCHLSVAGQFFVLECDNVEMFSVHTNCFVFIAVSVAEHKMQFTFSV